MVTKNLSPCEPATAKRVRRAEDWANPGKQAGDSPLRSRSATSDTASRAGPGGSNRRSVTARVAGASGFATLTGVYADTGVDTDGDGAYNYLRLDVGVEVAEAELYNVVAWLSASDGEELAWAAHQQSLAPGSPHGRTGRRTARCCTGPARMGPTRFSGSKCASATGNCSPTPRTMPAPRRPTPIRISTRRISPSPEPTPKPPSMPIRTGWRTSSASRWRVDVQRAGNYTLIGELDAGSPLVATRTVVDLTPGIRTMTLDFDGSSLFQNRIDGPYALTRLRLLDAESVLIRRQSRRLHHKRLSPHGVRTYGHDHRRDQLRGGLADDDEDGRYEALRLLFLVDVDQRRRLLGHRPISTTRINV